MSNSTNTVLRDLVSEMPQGGLLPSLQFFKPAPRFLEWMKVYCKGRGVVYDVGAGCGHVTRKLIQAGVGTVALDLNYRENAEVEVEISNSVLYEYLPDSVVMFCRPCHGPFVELTIDRAIRCRAGSILYVGKPSKVAGDLGQFRKRFRRVLSNAGEEGEAIYAMEACNGT